MNQALSVVTPMTASIHQEKEAWNLMRDQAAILIKTGFLPDAIKTPEQAMAVMMKGRELGVPPMYALSNIAVVKGKPTCSAELMLALIRRDHGPQAMRVKESTNDTCTVEWRTPGWDGTQQYIFSLDDAKRAGLVQPNSNWTKFPAAMLRARCVSAVARMAFPESIAGMYSPGELGEQVIVTDEGEVLSGEVLTVPGAVVVPVDTETGEILETEPADVAAFNAEQEYQESISDANKPKGAFGEPLGTVKQMKDLHFEASQRGLDHDDVHALAGLKGFESITEMTGDQLKTMGAWLRGVKPAELDMWLTKAGRPTTDQRLATAK